MFLRMVIGAIFFISFNLSAIAGSHHAEILLNYYNGDIEFSEALKTIEKEKNLSESLKDFSVNSKDENSGVHYSERVFLLRKGLRLASDTWTFLDTAEMAELVSSLLQKIEDYKKQGIKPLLVIDLDDTVVHHGSRIFTLIQKYRSLGLSTMSDGTSLFETANLAHLPIDEERKKYLVHLAEKESDLPQDVLVQHVFNSLIPYIDKNFRNPDSYEYDAPISEMIELVRILKNAGAEVLYLTARYADTPDRFRISLRQLKRLHFPEGKLRMRTAQENGFKADKFKFHALKKYLEENPNHRVLLGADDQHLNLRAIERAAKDSDSVLLMPVNTVNPKTGEIRLNLYRSDCKTHLEKEGL